MAVENSGFQDNLFDVESAGQADDSRRMAGLTVPSGADGAGAESDGAGVGFGSGAVGEPSVGAFGRDTDGGGVREQARGADSAPDAGSSGSVGAEPTEAVLAGAATGRPASDSSERSGRGFTEPVSGATGGGISGASPVSDSSAGAGAGGQKRPEVAGEPVDFEPTGEVLVPSGAKARAVANLDAIELVKKLNAENRYATAEEQAVLAKFSSWGATVGIFDEKNEAYADLRERMQQVLGDEEIAEAREASLNAHFTNPAIVQSMWSVLERAGFKGGAVLEPGCGSGNFIGAAPASAQMIGVELDGISAQIAHYLYPSATIYAEGFENLRLPEQTLSAAVGNVPFGDYRIVDRVDNSEALSIHNYFINKSMKRLAPGGYGAFITSAFTMDAKTSKARAAIAEHSDLVAAVRLPDHAFAEVAGTKVVTDILVFRRRADDEAPDRAKQAQEWVNGYEETTETGETVITSRFFAQNPDFVLGQRELRTNQYGQPQFGVTSPDTMAVLATKVREGLSEQLRKAGEAGLGYEPQLVPTAATKLESFAPGGVVTLDEMDTAIEGTVRFNQGTGKVERFDALLGQWEAVKAGGRNGVSEAEMRSLLSLKEQTRRVLDAESDDERREHLSALNDSYDRYVQKYGFINRFTLVQGLKPKKTEVNRRLREFRKLWLENQDTEGLTKAEIRALEPDEQTLAQWEAEANAPDSFRKVQNHLTFLKTDSDFGKLIALEDFDDEEQVGKKSRLFEVSTYTTKTAPSRAETPAEALSISLDETRSVDLERIGELLGVSEDEAVEQLGDLVFKDPADGQYVPAVGYLSGNVREKLEVAEEAAALDSSYLRNVEALKDVLPPWAGIEKIHLQVGASFMTQEQYRQFALETFGVPLTITKSPDGTGWEVPHRNADMKPSVRLTYGTKRRGPADLLDAVMNNRQPKVSDKVKDPHTGKEKYVLNEKETKEARLKAAKIEYTFKKWISSSPARVAQVEREFNRRFNSYVAPDYSVLGQHLALKDISPDFTPHPYQREAVARIVNEPSVLLDHVVGAGKTGSMIMGALELRNRGIAQKPLFVVPNHLVEQITREFSQWAPTSQVLMIPTGISATERKVYAAKALAGDWDAVIMPQSIFNRVGLSAGRQSQFLREDIDALIAQKQSSGDDMTVKAIEKLIKRKETRMEELFARKDEGVTFEELGCDYLFVDEAHDFKNLGRVSDYQELSCAGSMRAADLDFILRALREDKIQASGGLNRAPAVATFATGTPIANSLSELWVMMHYLRPDVLEDLGISSIDSWARVFTRAEPAMEVQPSGLGFRIVNKITEYENLEQLKQLNSLFTSTVTRDQIPQKLPSIVGGTMKNINRDASEHVKSYMDDVVKTIENPGPEDYLIEVLGRARRVALDPRLVGLEADEDGGRPRLVANEVMRIHRQYQDTEYLGADGAPTVLPGGLQVIFCDQGAPGTSAEFNMYDAMKEELVAAGMPVEKIAYIHDAGDDAERAELFSRCRSGEVSVLIGSTQKMGTGMNVQQRLTAIHHVDIPWRPADLEQREGRGIRQGNQNDEIEILSYGTKGTFDAYSWQVIARKLKALNQWKAGEGLDSMESLSGDGDPQMMIAWLTDNPALMEQLTLTVEVQRLLMEKNAESSSAKDLEFEISTTEARMSGLESTMKLYEVAIAHQAFPGVQFFLGDKVFDGRTKEAGEQLLRGLALLNIAGAKSPDTFYQLGQIGNIPFVGQLDAITGSLNLRLVDPVSGQVLPGSGHSVEPNKIAAGQVSGIGQLARLVRAASTLDAQLEALQQRHQMLGDEMISLRSRLSEARVGFAKQDELDEKLLRLEQLSADLGIDSLETEDFDQGEADTRVDDPEAVLNDDEVELLYGHITNVNDLREGDVIEIGSGQGLDRGLYRVYSQHPVTGQKPHYSVFVYEDEVVDFDADTEFPVLRSTVDFELASRLYSALDERDKLILGRAETDWVPSAQHPEKTIDYVKSLEPGAQVTWFTTFAGEGGKQTIVPIDGVVQEVISTGWSSYEVTLLDGADQEHKVMVTRASPGDFIHRDGIDLEAAAAAEEAAFEAELADQKKVSSYRLLYGDMLLKDVEGIGRAGYQWVGTGFIDPQTLESVREPGFTPEKAYDAGLLTWDDIAPGRVLDATETVLAFDSDLNNATIGDLRSGDVVDGQKLAPKAGITEPVRILGVSGWGSKLTLSYRKVSDPIWAEEQSVNRMSSSKVGAITERRFGALKLAEKAALSEVETRQLTFDNVPEEVYGSWVSVVSDSHSEKPMRHFGILRNWKRSASSSSKAEAVLEIDGQRQTFTLNSWDGEPTLYVQGTPSDIDWRGMPLGVDGLGSAQGTGFEGLRGFRVPDFGTVREFTRADEEVSEVSGEEPVEAVSSVPEFIAQPVDVEPEPALEPVAATDKDAGDSDVEVLVPSEVFVPHDDVVEVPSVQVLVTHQHEGDIETEQEATVAEDNQVVVAEGSGHAEVKVVAEDLEQVRHDVEEATEGISTVDSQGQIITKGLDAESSLAVGVARAALKAAGYEQDVHDTELVDNGEQLRPLNDLVVGDYVVIRPSVTAIAPAAEYGIELTSQEAGEFFAEEDVLVAYLAARGQADDWNSHVFEATDSRGSTYQFTLNTVYPVRELPVLSDPAYALEHTYVGEHVNRDSVLRNYGSVAPATLIVGDRVSFAGVKNRANYDQVSGHDFLVLDVLEAEDEELVYLALQAPDTGDVLEVEASWDNAVYLKRATTDEWADIATRKHQEWIDAKLLPVSVEEVDTGQTVTVVGTSLDEEPIQVSGEVTFVDAGTPLHGATVQVEDASGEEITVVEVKQVLEQPAGSAPATDVAPDTEPQSRPARLDENIGYVGVEDLTAPDVPTASGQETTTLTYGQVRAGDRITDGTGNWYSVYKSTIKPDGDVELAFRGQNQMFTTTMPAATTISADPYPAAPFYGKLWEQVEANRVRPGDLLNVFDSSNKALTLKVLDVRQNAMGMLVADVQGPGGVRDDFPLQPRDLVKLKAPLCEEPRDGIVGGAQVSVPVQNLEVGNVISLHGNSNRRGVVLGVAEMPDTGLIRVHYQQLDGPVSKTRSWDFPRGYSAPLLENHHGAEVAQARSAAGAQMKSPGHSPELRQGPEMGEKPASFEPGI